MDDFIGRKFGDREQLKVIAQVGRSTSGRKKYIVKCTICAGDAELHGNGEYTTYKNNLEFGKIPCGCSKRSRWTETQYMVRINRMCAEKDYSFVEVINTWRGHNTKIRLRCNKDSHTWEVVTTCFLSGSGCPSCGKESTRKHATKEDSAMFSKFIASGSFTQGTTFKRSGNHDNHGQIMWEVACPACSSDEYVRAGVCSGVFVSNTTHLSSGRLSCRCSPSFRWTKQQREYQLRKAALEDNHTFIGWVGEYKGSHSRVTLECPEHGRYEPMLSNYLNKGSRCPVCSVSGFKRGRDASIYVLKVVGDYSFTGYGISNIVSQRIATHKRKLLLVNSVVDDMEVFPTTGEEALHIESEIKLNFERCPQNIEGFRTEATHIHKYMDVVGFIEGQLITGSS